MYIIGLHPELHPEPFVRPVPFMQNEVEAMMSDQRRVASVVALACLMLVNYEGGSREQRTYRVLKVGML